MIEPPKIGKLYRLKNCAAHGIPVLTMNRAEVWLTVNDVIMLVGWDASHHFQGCFRAKMLYKDRAVVMTIADPAGWHNCFEEIKEL